MDVALTSPALWTSSCKQWLFHDTLREKQVGLWLQTSHMAYRLGHRTMSTEEVRESLP